MIGTVVILSEAKDIIERSIRLHKTYHVPSNGKASALRFFTGVQNDIYSLM